MEAILTAKKVPSGGMSYMKGYEKAIELLHKAVTPRGFASIACDEEHCRRIWTRSSTLCGLAALTTGDEDLKLAFKRSIETIFQHQHRNGFIPSHMNPSVNQVSYGTAVGRVDNHAWIVIAACTYAYVEKDYQWLRKYRSAIDKCFNLMNAWEFNGRCMMYVPQSGDWADEYYHHGFILYDQLLRIWALRCAGKVFRNSAYAVRASRLRIAVENYFTGNEFYSLQVERMWEGKQFDYWIMGFNPSTLYTQFDLQANVLSLLLGIGSNERQMEVVRYMAGLAGKHDHMLPSFHPAIGNDKGPMMELRNNHSFGFRNNLHEHYNGGSWPVWNGLTAMTLSGIDSELSAVIGSRVDHACSTNDWEFNECYHGVTGEPVGVPHCAWSAAGLILSKNSNEFSERILIGNR